MYIQSDSLENKRKQECPPFPIGEAPLAPFFTHPNVQAFLQNNTCFYDMRANPLEHMPWLSLEELKVYQLLSLDQFIYVGANQVTSEIIDTVSKERLWLTTFWMDGVERFDNMFVLSVMGKLVATRKLVRAGLHPPIRHLGRISEFEWKKFLSLSKQQIQQLVPKVEQSQPFPSLPAGQCFESFRFQHQLRVGAYKSRNLLLMFCSVPADGPFVPMNMLRLANRGTETLAPKDFAKWLTPLRSRFCKSTDTGKRGHILHDVISSSQCFVSVADVRERWCSLQEGKKAEFLSRPKVAAILDTSLFTESLAYVSRTLEDYDQYMGAEGAMRDWDQVLNRRAALVEILDQLESERKFTLNITEEKEVKSGIPSTWRPWSSKQEEKKQQIPSLSVIHPQEEETPETRRVMDQFERCFFGRVGDPIEWSLPVDTDPFSNSYRLFSKEVTPLGDHVDQEMKKIHSQGEWRWRPEPVETARTWKPIWTLVIAEEKKQKKKKRQQQQQQSSWRYGVWYEMKNYMTDPYVRRRVSDVLFSIAVEYAISKVAHEQRLMEEKKKIQGKKGGTIKLQLRSILDPSLLLDEMDHVWISDGNHKIHQQWQHHSSLLPPDDMLNSLKVSDTPLPQDTLPIEKGFVLIHTRNVDENSRIVELGHAIRFFLVDNGSYSFDHLAVLLELLSERITEAFRHLLVLCREFESRTFTESLIRRGTTEAEYQLLFMFGKVDSLTVTESLIHKSTLVPRINHKNQIWIRLPETKQKENGWQWAQKLKPTDIVFRDISFAWMDTATRLGPEAHWSDWLQFLLYDAVFSLYLLIGPTIPLTELENPRQLILFLQCQMDASCRIHQSGATRTNLVSLVHNDSLSTALMGKGSYGLVFHSKKLQEVIKVGIHPLDSQHPDALYQETKIGLFAAEIGLGPKIHGLVPVTWNTDDVPPVAEFKMWHLHNTALALCMENLQSLSSLADAHNPYNLIHGKYSSEIIPDFRVKMLQCVYYDIERTDPNLANYFCTNDKKIRMIDFGVLESAALPFCASLDAQAGYTMSRIFTDLNLRGGVRTLDSLFGIHATIAQDRKSHVLLPLTSAVLIELPRLLMGLLRFTVLFSKEHQQLYLLAGEAHTFEHPSTKGWPGLHFFNGRSIPPLYIVNPSEYFHTLAELFPSRQIDMMVELNPIQTRKQWHTFLEELEALEEGDETKSLNSISFNFRNFLHTFQKYNAYRTPETDERKASSSTKRHLPWVRTSLVDSRINEWFPKSLTFLQANASVFHAMSQGIVSSQHDLQTVLQIRDTLDVIGKQLTTVDGLQQDFGYSGKTVPLLDIQIQISHIHLQFQAAIQSHLMEKHRQLVQDFHTAATSLQTLQTDFLRYVDSVDWKTHRLTKSFQMSVSYTVIQEKLFALLVDTMDIYVFTRFFHHFRKSQPSVAKNIMYLAGKNHTDNALEMLTQTMKFQVLYDVSADERGLIPVPSIDLIRAHFIQ